MARAKTSTLVRCPDQLTPTLGAGNLNYSNSDYDIRNNLVGDMVYEEPYKAANWLAE